MDALEGGALLSRAPPRDMVRLRSAAAALLIAGTMLIPVTESQMSMLALGDWGGGDTAPFFNDVERANANAMAGVMADPDTKTASFGLLMGDNFYSRGISCINKAQDPDCTTDVYSHRCARSSEPRPEACPRGGGLSPSWPHTQSVPACRLQVRGHVRGCLRSAAVRRFSVLRHLRQS